MSLLNNAEFFVVEKGSSKLIQLCIVVFSVNTSSSPSFSFLPNSEKISVYPIIRPAASNRSSNRKVSSVFNCIVTLFAFEMPVRLPNLNNMYGIKKYKAPMMIPGWADEIKK